MAYLIKFVMTFVKYTFFSGSNILDKTYLND